MNTQDQIRHPMMLMMVGCLLVALFNIDFIGTNIVFPALVSDFHLELVDAQWINNVFAAAVAISFLVGTRICMVYGLRETACFSMLVYAVFTLAVGQAGHFLPLLIYRGVMGFSCGVGYMAVLLVVLNVFPENQKGSAMGRVYAAMGVGMFLGPMMGAWVLKYFSWRALFYANVPIAFFILFGFWLWMPKKNFQQGVALNLISIVLSAVITGFLFFSLNNLSQGLFTWGILLMFLACLLAGFVLVARESRMQMPMIPLEVFRLPSFVSGLYVRLVGQIYFIVALTVLPLYLHNVLNVSILHVGYYMTIATVVIVVSSPLFGRLVDYWGSAKVNLLSLVLALLFSLLFLMLSPKNLNLSLFVVLLVLVGLVTGANFMATSLSPLQDIQVSRQNQALGLVFTFAMFGDVVGLMLFSSLNQQFIHYWLRVMKHTFTLLGLSSQQQSFVGQAIGGTISQHALRAHLSASQYHSLLPQINSQMMLSLKCCFVVVAAMAVIAIWSNYKTMRQ